MIFESKYELYEFHLAPVHHGAFAGSKKNGQMGCLGVRRE